MKYLFVLISILPFGAFAELEIKLANNSEKERLKSAQLEKLSNSYDLNKWQFTDKVKIDESARRPFSHPTLTLTVNRPKNDGALLSQYLHEQIHWFEDSRKTEVENVIKEFKVRYPNAPVKGPEGARNQSSTYLHLAVCLMEYDALTELLGKEKARRIISTNAKYFYKWIYQKVLTDTEFIRSTLKKHSLYID